MAEPEARSFLTATYSEALLIGILTAGMYWFSFVYEVAYLTSYALPAHLVQVNLHIILQVVPIMAALAISIIIIASVIHSLPLPTQRKCYRILVVAFFPFVYFVNYGFRLEDWPFYAGVLAAIALFEFVWPILYYRSRPTVAERLLEFEDALQIGVPAYISVVILLFLLGTYNAYLHGRVTAERQSTYLVFEDAPDVAVIRVYSDIILAVPFDSKTRTVKRQVLLRKIGEDSTIRLTYSDVGPLRLPFISITLTVS